MPSMPLTPKAQRVALAGKYLNLEELSTKPIFEAPRLQQKLFSEEEPKFGHPLAKSTCNTLGVEGIDGVGDSWIRRAIAEL